MQILKSIKLNNTFGFVAPEQLLIIIGAGFLLHFTTACSVTAGEAWGAGDRGRILISADSEGMQAFSDLIQGSINNGKASPDQDTSHYQMRREQVRVKALKSFTSYGAGAQQSKPTGAVQLGREFEGAAK